MAVPSVSVVVPVFGDGGELDDLVRRVSAVLEPRDAAWEIILVNDGSPLPAWDRIRGLTGRANVRAINLRRNFGQQNALLAGIRASAGQIIVTMDDDLQHPPEQIPRLLENMGAAELVYGTPATRVRGWGRNIVAALTKAAMATVLGTAHARSIAAFRAFDGGFRPVFQSYHSPFVSIDVLLSWATARITAVPVTYAPRRRGKSGYRVLPLVTLVMNMVTGFSVWPLRLASLLGLAAAVFGTFAFAFVVIRYLTADVTVPGFAFLASLIATLAGVQLFALGIMGEYLARMHFRTMDRPAYLVESTVNIDTPGSAV